MELHSFLQDIVITFGAALLVTGASRLLRVPAVVGLLITGCVVGPYGARLVQNPASVEAIAELGVVFLLFEIGLELSIKRLRGMGRYFLLGGSVQSASTILLTIGAAILCGYGLRQSAFMGMVLSLSSTAVVMRLYSDRRETDTPHASIALGILLFQDILIVPDLLLVPLLGGGVHASFQQFLLRLGGGLLILGGAFAASRFAIPRTLHYLATTRVRELLVIASLFLCLGAALVSRQVGFSMALGAFLAGVLIADSDYQHQVIAETSPIRDVFTSLFFVSVGMLLRLDFLVDHPLAVLAATALILLIKGAGLFATVRVLAFPSAVAATVALGLSQIGEFSFVLLQVGKANGVLDDWTYQLLIASSILTMGLTPLLMRIAPAVGGGIGAADGRRGGSGDGRLADHVVIVGYGLAGRHLSRVLKSAAIPYVIVEFNGETVKKAKAAGEPIFYGDATREPILEQCGIRGCRVMVIVIPDKLSVLRAVRLARRMNPNLFIIVRTRMQTDIEELRASGADDVVSEEFETSIEIFTHVLARLHVPGSIIRTQTRLLRSNDYRMLRTATTHGHLSGDIGRALAVGATDTFLIAPEMAAAGKSILELDLRKRTGATVIAVVRDNRPVTNPAPQTRIVAGDLLVLVGSHAQIDAAFSYLQGPAAQEPATPAALTNARGGAGPAPDAAA